MRGLVLAEQAAANDNGYSDWLEEADTRLRLAARWREAAGQHPAAADALRRAADKQEALAGRLLTENWMDATLTNQIQGRVRMPLTSGGRKPNGMTEMGEAADSHSVLRRLGLRL